MFNAKDSGLTRMNYRGLLQRQSFMEEMLCCVDGEITAKLFILIFKPQKLSADLYSS